MSKKKKILCTGGMGFIGSHIVNKLIESGNEVFVIDNLCHGDTVNIKTDNFLNTNLIFLKEDIRDYKTMNKLFKEYKPEYVCHQAALASVPESFKNFKEYHEVNVTGTFNIFNLCVQHKVKKIVFASSSSIYGKYSNRDIHENIKKHNASPYALTKKINEEYANVFKEQFGLNYIALRYFNVFGSNQKIETDGAVITTFIDKIKKDEPIIIYGDGNQIRDFVYVKDVVEANINALESSYNGALNIGTEIGYSINKLVFHLRQIMKKEIIILQKEKRLGDIENSVSLCYKARNEIGWKPKYTLIDGLKEMLTT